MSGTLGQYTLVREVGRGAMGEVWLGHDERLDRFVAIKMMRCEIADDPLYVQRFEREARAVAKLSHPHIVQIYGIGEQDGILYFAMEWVDGETLGGRIREGGAIPRREALRMMIQAAEALDYACQLGVIHRDIKPGNIMLDAAGRVKITDFGLAKLADVETQMTRTGTPLGSPNYMSPEACRGEDLDHRSDIYSLGVTFYQMLNGELPYSASSPMSVMYKQVNEPLPEPPVLRMLDNGIWLEVLRRMTAKTKEERYRTYKELREALAVLEHASTAAGAALASPVGSGSGSMAAVSSPGPIFAPGALSPLSATAPLEAASLSSTLPRPIPVVPQARDWPWAALKWGGITLGAGLVVVAGLFVLDTLQEERGGPRPIASGPVSQPVLASPDAPAHSVLPGSVAHTGSDVSASLPAAAQAGAVPQPVQTTQQVTARSPGSAQNSTQLAQKFAEVSPLLLQAYQAYDFDSLATYVDQSLNSGRLDATTRQLFEQVRPYVYELRGYRTALAEYVGKWPNTAHLPPEEGGFTVAQNTETGLLLQPPGGGEVRYGWSDMSPVQMLIIGHQFRIERHREKVQAFSQLYPGVREALPPPPGGEGPSSTRPGGMAQAGGGAQGGGRPGPPGGAGPAGGGQAPRHR